MALNYPSHWKYGSQGHLEPVPGSLIDEFVKLIALTARGTPVPQNIPESIKATFSTALGSSHFRSSTYDYAIQDLRSVMAEFSESAAIFVDTLWSGFEALAQQGILTPPYSSVNKLLRDHGIALEIDPPNLRSTVSAHSSATGAKADNGSSPTYLVGEMIGQGGFGTVHRATRRTEIADFVVAIKRCDPSPFVSNAQQARLRFQREIRAMQSLQHRGIVPYLDAGIEMDGCHYVVMPLVEGSDIRSFCEKLSFGRRMLLLAEVLDAVDYAHQCHILHRDLKPSNILVRSSDFQPVVLDFGFSYIFDDLDSASLTTQLVGSLGYIPPEVQANPRLRTTGQDIFACGVIAYELLAGKRPIVGAYETLTAVAANLAPFDDAIWPALAAARDRYATAKSFREGLQRALSKYGKD